MTPTCTDSQGEEGVCPLFCTPQPSSTINKLARVCVAFLMGAGSGVGRCREVKGNWAWGSNSVAEPCPLHLALWLPQWPASNSPHHPTLCSAGDQSMRIMNLASLKTYPPKSRKFIDDVGFFHKRKEKTMKTPEQTQQVCVSESPGAEAPALFPGSWQPGPAV